MFGSLGFATVFCPNLRLLSNLFSCQCASQFVNLFLNHPHDEPHNRDLLADLLRPLGFDVVEAAHGAAALDLAKSRRPDIVLLDLLMPEMDGFEVAHKLRLMSDPEDGQMTIIAVSANAFEQQMLESELAGCDAFLAKPIDVDRLLSLLQVHADLTWLSDEGCERTLDRLEQRSSAAITLVPPGSDDLAVLIDLAMKGELPSLMKMEWYAPAGTGIPCEGSRLRPDRVARFVLVPRVSRMTLSRNCRLVGRKRSR